MTIDVIDQAAADKRARIDGLERQLEEAQAEVARLNDQVKEWSKASIAIVATCVSETKRAEAAERQLAEEKKVHAETSKAAVKWLYEKADAERQLAEAQAQHEADKERGHKYRDKLVARAEAAERQLTETQAALANCLSLVELKFGNTDEVANAAIEQARAALQDRAPAEGEG